LRPRDSFALEYAYTCSRPRLDGFGGGAVFVTAEGIECVETAAWVAERRREHEIGRGGAEGGSGAWWAGDGPERDMMNEKEVDKTPNAAEEADMHASARQRQDDDPTAVTTIWKWSTP